VRFRKLALPGAYRIDLDLVTDERGYFARTWCQQEFQDHGLETGLAQCSLSFNRRQGTLRGMHLQLPPHAEAKLVRCTRGAIYDVVLDLRLGSATFGAWVAETLTADSRCAVYVPPGCAHGFETLADDSEVFYQISQLYAPEHGWGARWNDPRFAIQWPLPVSVMSERDRQYTDFDAQSFAALNGAPQEAD